MAGLSMLRVVNNAAMDEEEKRRRDAEADARQSQPVVLGLAGYLRACWDAARDAKRPIETLMIKAKRQRAGEYEPDTLAEIRKHGGSEIFMRITEVKCRSAEAWIRDILLDGGPPPWDLKATPIPELTPLDMEDVARTVADKVLGVVQSTRKAPSREELMEMKEVALQEHRFKLQQLAQNKADRMKDKIADQFAQGGWYDAFDQFVTDLTTYPAAFVKGPVVRRHRQLAYEQVGGKTEVIVRETLAPEFERVDPFRIYPEPGISEINDGYLFEHHPLSRSDLSELIGVPGYDDDAIRRLLEREATTESWFFDHVEITKNELERKHNSWRSPTAMYDALEFWGRVSGKMLREWGMSQEDIPDETREYDANVWVVGSTVIKATLNYDPMGEKPYAKTCMIKVPGAFWGMSIPEMIEDIQNVCNASARALVNNMGIASGPQVEVNVERLPPNEDITQVYPWKIWQSLNDPHGVNAPAIRFHQPNDNAQTLMAVYEKFSRLADEHSGIPAYVSGDISVQGAGRTSSGLSMLMGAAGKGIRQVVTAIDNDVVKVIVWRQFVYNMRYDADETIKGDLVVVPRGAVNLAVKETVNVRRVEFLTATANPFDAEIMGKSGRAAVLREVAKSLQMPEEEIVPSREKAAMMGRADVLSAVQTQQAQAGQQQALPTPTDPSGAPKGGMAGNVVSSRDSGAA